MRRKGAPGPKPSRPTVSAVGASAALLAEAMPDSSAALCSGRSLGSRPLADQVSSATVSNHSESVVVEGSLAAAERARVAKIIGKGSREGGRVGDASRETACRATRRELFGRAPVGRLRHTLGYTTHTANA